MTRTVTITFETDSGLANQALISQYTETLVPYADSDVSVTISDGDLALDYGDVEATYRVLETLRDDILENPEHETLNGAHSLIQEFEGQ